MPLSPSVASECWRSLREYSISLESDRSVSLALQRVLRTVLSLTGAKRGHLLAELTREEGWELLASIGGDDLPTHLREKLLLDDASSGGHLPICVGNRVFGCVFLDVPVAPGARESLETFATQAVLLLAARTTPGVADRKFLVGSLRELDERITRFASSALDFLLLGESGTGKALVARELHRRSRRSLRPFVTVSCSTLPASLLETRVLMASKEVSGGTIFLDDIGALAPGLQATVVRLLPEHGNFGVIASASRDPESVVLRRINGATLRVPPLRERGRDVLLFAELFLRRIAPSRDFTDTARARLLEHHWPGNLRELEQVTKRAAAFAAEASITAEDLALSRLLPLSAAPTVDACETLPGLREAQASASREAARQALESSAGVLRKAAGTLGISERALYRLLDDRSDDRELR